MTGSCTRGIRHQARSARVSLALLLCARVILAGISDRRRRALVLDASAATMDRQLHQGIGHRPKSARASLARLLRAWEILAGISDRRRSVLILDVSTATVGRQLHRGDQTPGKI